jgi:lipoprotein-releasing system ATP-binding protein
MNNNSTTSMTPESHIDKSLLVCQSLHKSYASNDTVVLRGVNLTIKKGETVSIVGSSGSGKSTLLHLLAGLDQATSGQILFKKHDITKLSDERRCELRNSSFGFIYQFHHLLAEFSTLENVLMPLSIRGGIPKEKKEFAQDILSKLSLSHRLNYYPSQLSGGERQRVAIARAVINNPEIIFADEPTGNLDNETASSVMNILFKLQQELGTSVVLVTHDMQLAKSTDNCYRLYQGKLALEPQA